MQECLELEVPPFFSSHRPTLAQGVERLGSNPIITFFGAGTTVVVDQHLGLDDDTGLRRHGGKDTRAQFRTALPPRDMARALVLLLFPAF